jgi:selenocysteine lyase/cysteine desulfurase
MSLGILVAKKKLFKNPVPTGCGGGTVFFVSRTSHRYLQENEMREEGGTPNIVGSIRAGLVFQLKEVPMKSIIYQYRTATTNGPHKVNFSKDK